VLTNALAVWFGLCHLSSYGRYFLVCVVAFGWNVRLFRPRTWCFVALGGRFSAVELRWWCGERGTACGERLQAFCWRTPLPCLAAAVRTLCLLLLIACNAAANRSSVSGWAADSVGSGI